MAIEGIFIVSAIALKARRCAICDFLSRLQYIYKTNGVTPPRWIALSNPRMTQLISQKIGEGWIKQLENLRQLEGYAEDAGFREDWREMKQAVKYELAHHIERTLGMTVDPYSLFDIQVKRIHEYKRQHLNVLHIIALYWRLKTNPSWEISFLELKSVSNGFQVVPRHKYLSVIVWTGNPIIKFIP